MLSIELKTYPFEFRRTNECFKPQGSIYVGTGSGAPEVPELPSSWGYSRATRPQGDINSGDWSSTLGVGRRANNPAPLKMYRSETQKGG
jgi:hypothetical protein